MTKTAYPSQPSRTHQAGTSHSPEGRTSSPTNWTPWLTLAGTLPFVLPAIWLTIGWSWTLLGDAHLLMSSYGLLIVSFMAGSLWGIHLKRTDGWSRFLPVFTNAVALVCWFSFLMLSFTTQMWVLALSFSLLWLVDLKLWQEHIITKGYMAVRTVASGIVVFSLLVAAGVV